MSKVKPRSQTIRDDIAVSRVDESTYVANIPKPALGRNGEWVIAAYAKGTSLEEIIRATGLKTLNVLGLCGISAKENPELVARLDEFRSNLTRF